MTAGDRTAGDRTAGDRTAGDGTAGDLFGGLRRSAAAAALKAYAPYSAFRVGAALSSENGVVYTGCNVENAAFPVGNCAERNAIAAAVVAEGPEMRVAAIAVVALDPSGEETICAPCGACRQAILEFGVNAQVIFRAAEDAGDESGIVSVAAVSLIPGAFSFRPPDSS